jgi:predicted ATPase/DNA-binding winged helix-turn-helix (wHTH) protein
MANSGKGEDSRTSGSAGEADERSGAMAVPEMTFSFGPFRLLPRQHLLLKDYQSVPLGSRACEILVALVERAGELLDRNFLEARAWPGITVEESNLRAQITALRRVLAQGGAGVNYVVAVKGRGYRFAAPVARSTGEAVRAQVVHKGHNLPGRLTRPIGRSDVIATVRSRLQQRRFITIIGPGGIGKTTVALAVADKLMSSYKDGVRFVDLAPISDPMLVPNALAAVLGVAIHSENPYPALTSFLKDRRMLLVMDTCEHVLEASAKLTEELLKAAPGVHILATSRERLRAENESVQRLSALETPPPSAALTAAAALTYPAVQLFVERASATADGYKLTDEDAPLVAQVCRRLELAAGRVGAFGVHGVLARLDDRFQVLTHGRRTALARHQTLRAALDWSYELLSEAERVVIRRLGVFAGRFTMRDASTVVGYAAITASVVDESVANLVDKSLVTVDVGAAVVYYRLSDTARAYAAKKLVEHGELQMFTKRHAEYHRDLIMRAEAEWHTSPTAEWRNTYIRKIDDVRAALDWAFSPIGDVSIGVSITAAAVPLWFEMFLLEECRARVECALQAIEQGAAKDDSAQVRLYVAIALSQAYTINEVRNSADCWSAALRIAEVSDDTEYQLRSLWGIWGRHVNRGEFRDGLAVAKQFRRLAECKSDSNDQLIGDRLIGATMHFLGDQMGAKMHIERMLRGYVSPVRRSDAVRFQSDQRVTGRMYLARILWLSGLPDQARTLAEANVRDAQTIDHPQSLCNALAGAACQVSLLTGDLDAADRHLSLLLQQTARDGLHIWRAQAGCIQGELLIKRGKTEVGLACLRDSICQLFDAGFTQYVMVYLAVLAEAYAAAGDRTRAPEVIEDAIARADRHGGHWCTPELLRVKGNILLHGGVPEAAQAAEAQFLMSLDLARKQEALAWELRAATSFARLRRDCGHSDAAYEVLAPVYGRFVEGYWTVDLKAAKDLLDQLPPPRPEQQVRTHSAGVHKYR